MRGWYGGPAMRQELADPAGRLQWQSLKDVAQICIRVVPVDARGVQQAHDGRSPLAGAQAAGQEPVRSSNGDRSDLVFYPVALIGRRPSPKWRVSASQLRRL